MDFATILQSIGIVATLIVSIWTLKESQKDSQQQNVVGIMVQKRSARLDQLRDFSSQIITYSKCLLYNTSDTDLLKEKLLFAVQGFISLLQNQYPHDIELIALARNLETIFLYNSEYEANIVDKIIKAFWVKCDLYIGTEHERLKMESSGIIPNSGEVEAEENNFNNIYIKLAEKSLVVNNQSKQNSHNQNDFRAV